MSGGRVRGSTTSGIAQPSALGLRRVDVLLGVPDAVLDGLARESIWRSFDPDQYIISRDADDHSACFIVAGRVRVTMYSSSGKQVTFTDQGAGELVGELAAIDGGRRALDVIALEPTLVAAIPPAIFMQLLLSQPLVAERVLRRLTRLLRDTAERVIELSTLGVQNRIHAELLRLAVKAGIEGNRARLAPAPKHTDIASRVSTSREQVTREMTVLANAHVIAKDGAAMVVLDVEQLARMVEEVRGAA
jgi:CRP-like cAMP-binding protein